MCTIADEKLDRNHMASYSCPFHTSNLSCMQVNVHLASLTKQEGEQRLNSSQVITWWITCCTWQGKANYPQCCIKLAGFTFVQLYCDKYRLSLQSVHFVSPFSGQGDVHGGKLWAKGRGAGVCKPTQWGTQRHDVTLPICDQVLLYRWRQDLPLGLGVEPHCQEGLELIESERDDANLFFPSYLHLLLFLLLLRLLPLRPVKAVLQWLETEGSTSPPLPP